MLENIIHLPGKISSSQIDFNYDDIDIKLYYNKQYLTIVSLQDSNVIGWKASSSSLLKTISISTDDGTTWTTKESSTEGTTLATLNTGDKLLIKGSNTAYCADSYYNYFISTANFNVEGNIMSLCYGDNFIGQTILDSVGFNFRLIFNACSKLISTKHLILPATTLANYCYANMFYNCTSLTTAPELPATTLNQYCYNNMFYGCTSLTTAPELPATILATYCYYYMFYGCTSLTTAPELPAITLATYCYGGMFNDCTSLIVTPELTATTLVSGCYQQMFKGCTSLTTAPELSATTLVSGCYQQMFSNCISLNYIKCLATDISVNGCISNWVNNVASSGTFIKANSMTSWTTGNNGIPSNWDVYTESEYETVRHYELPAASSTVTQNDTNPVSGGAVYAKFEDLIGSAPAALDTLQEIATALNNDADLAGTLTTQISSKIPKVSNPTADNFASFNSDGTIKDSGHSHSDYITSIKTVNNESLVGTGNIVVSGLPQVSASDNGKILMVVNGQWTLVSPSVLYSGNGIPNNANGNNGDLFMQTD